MRSQTTTARLIRHLANMTPRIGDRHAAIALGLPTRVANLGNRLPGTCLLLMPAIPGTDGNSATCVPGAHNFRCEFAAALRGIAA